MQCLHSCHLKILAVQISQSKLLRLKKVYKNSRVFVHNGHLVHPLNVIRLLLKRMTKMNVLVLGLQWVVEHLQSRGLVMFSKIPAGQRKPHGLESVLLGCWNNFAAQQEWGEKRESSQQVVQAQEAHAPEIRLRIAALKANFTPLFGDAAVKRCVRTKFLPQLWFKQTTDQSKSS